MIDTEASLLWKPTADSTCAPLLFQQLVVIIQRQAKLALEMTLICSKFYSGTNVIVIVVTSNVAPFMSLL